MDIGIITKNHLINRSLVFDSSFNEKSGNLRFASGRLDATCTYTTDASGIKHSDSRTLLNLSKKSTDGLRCI